jgi:predicted RNA-binding Zn ribbon-like protein
VETREPAPGRLALVEQFLRTRNELTDPPDLDRWRADRGLAGEVTPEAYERAMRLREALRALMLANNGGVTDPAAVDLVNAEIDACGLRPAIEPAGSAVRLGWRRGDAEARPGDALVGTVLTGVVTAVADGSWPRMKACAADDCHYAFYDHTRNRSGRWCDVAGCGANARMRAYRRRLSGGPRP